MVIKFQVSHKIGMPYSWGFVMFCFKDIPDKDTEITNYGYLHSESGSAVDVVVLFLDGDRQSVRLSSFTTRVKIATALIAVVYQRPIVSRGIDSEQSVMFQSVV